MSKVFTIAISVVGLAVFAQWMVSHPLASPAPRDFLPLFVDLPQMAVKKGMLVGTACLWLIAVTGALASALALFLAVKGGAREGSRRLATALGASALALAYFYFLVPYPIAGVWAGPATPPGALLVLDICAFALWALGMLSLVLFFQVFPQPVSTQDWERHLAVWQASNREIYTTGWRKWVYPSRLSDPAYAEGLEQGNALARIVASTRSAKSWARMHRVPQSRATFPILCVFALGAALAQYAIRIWFTSLPNGARAPYALVFLPTNFIWFLGLLATVLAFAYLKYHRKQGSDEDRRRLAWIESTAFVAGVLSFGIFQAGFAAFILLVFFALDALPAGGLEQLLLIPLLLGIPLFGLACTVALALSVFYRGAIDPRHAAQRVTVWGLLGLFVTVVFVLLERAVTVKLTQWLSLPAETGPLVAGALVAATVAPVRTRVERMTQSLSSRFMPLDVIAGGRKQQATIALSDLSGYTAMAEKDEKQALLLAALLQQRAARVASTHGGRVVKSMGDAVLFEFEEPARACAALRELHAGFGGAAEALGVTPLALHSGAHSGEVTLGPDGDVYGQTVNLAARLQGQAADGEIVVSDVLARAANVLPEQLRTLGARSLKNVRAPVLCHVLLAESTPANTGSDQRIAQRAVTSR